MNAADRLTNSIRRLETSKERLRAFAATMDADDPRLAATETAIGDIKLAIHDAHVALVQARKVKS